MTSSITMQYLTTSSYPPAPTTPYSYKRFKNTVRVFLQAKAAESPLRDLAGLNLRDTRQPRSAIFDPKGRWRLAVGGVDESDEEDEDYDPGNKSPKKLAKAKAGLKRKAEDPYTEERPPKTPKTPKTPKRTAELSKEERRTDKTSFVSLQVSSDAAKARLRGFAEYHKNDVKDVAPMSYDDSEWRQTYFDRLDEEVAQIDNEGGRALRNRKIDNPIITPAVLGSAVDLMEDVRATEDEPGPSVKSDSRKAPKASTDNLRKPVIDLDAEEFLDDSAVPELDPRIKCQKCKKYGKKCICHLEHIKIPKKDEPSTVPMSAPSKRDLQRLSPSPKGKERGPTPGATSSTGLLTPPSSGARASSRDTSITSSRSVLPRICLRGKSHREVSDPPDLVRYYEEDKDRIFALLPTIIQVDDAGTKNAPIMVPEGDGLFKIKTRWKHPIEFRHVPKPHSPCSFCTDDKYGVWGEVERTVIVKQDPKSVHSRYIELDSEPAVNLLPTRMCIRCAINRLHIITCPQHQYTELDFGKMDPVELLSLEELYKQQVAKIPGTDAGEKFVLDACSICIMPARFRCCGEQQLDELRRPVPRPNNLGCGLKVCENCRDLLLKYFPGRKLRKAVLTKVVEEWNDEVDKSTDKHYRQTHGIRNLRRDVEFICKNSLLERAYLRQTRKSTPLLKGNG